MSKAKWQWDSDGALIINGQKFELIGKQEEFEEWGVLLSIDRRIFNVFVAAMNSQSSGRGQYGPGSGYDDGYSRTRDIVCEESKAHVLYDKRLRDIDAFVKPPKLSVLFANDGDGLEKLVSEIGMQRQLKKAAQAKGGGAKPAEAAKNGKE